MSVESLLSKNSYKFCDLCEIMELLRSENGCPWDKEQTNQSIRNNLIEECYELVEGIDADDSDIMKEELGDVLLQVVFHAKISQDKGSFCIDDVADGICKKLIQRHPHIFSDTVVSGSAQVLENWDEIKKKEKGQKTLSDTINSVSRALPSLVRAAKISGKAAKAGFEYPDADGALEKIVEELDEVRNENSRESSETLSEEIGDLLFAVANYARMKGINAEEALYRANDKFCKRFEKTEELAQKAGKSLASLNNSEKIVLWNEAKKC